MIFFKNQTPNSHLLKCIQMNQIIQKVSLNERCKYSDLDDCDITDELFNPLKPTDMHTILPVTFLNAFMA